MGINSAIDISKEQKKCLLSLLKTHLPNTKIWAYGSRVKWSARPNSDLDLVAFTNKQQTLTIENLKEALAESELPFSVDLLVWDDIPERFQANIKARYVELQSDEVEGLPSGWRVVELGDVGKIITGKTPLTKKVENFGKDYMFITPRDMNNQKYIRHTERKLSKIGFNSIIKNAIPKNSISVSCIGLDMGKVLITIKECATNQQINSLIIKEELPEYIYYYLSTKQDEIKNYASGSAVPIMNKTAFSQLKIILPPLPEQKAIAHILGKLDDKIELNRQISQTLETMAQALFKSWFVDFDPVIDNAIKAGNKIPKPLQHKADKRNTTKSTLPKDLQALFPDSFVFNDALKKWIPEDWELTTIEEVSTVIGGGTPSTKIDKYYCKKGIAWLSPKDLSNYSWKYIKKGKIDITGLGLQKSSAKLMPKGTILFSSRAPIGYIAIAENEICTNQGFKSIVPNKGIPTEYLFQFLKFNTEKIKSIATGSTFAEISGTMLKELSIIKPSVEVLDLLGLKVKSINNQSLLNQKQTKTLTKLRDNLLPKLISGKIRV